MKEMIFGAAENGKGDKLLTHTISTDHKRCSVAIYEVFPQHEIGAACPDNYDCDSMEPSVVLTFHNKKSLISVITALRETLGAWDTAEIDSEIRNMKILREEIKKQCREW